MAAQVRNETHRPNVAPALRELLSEPWRIEWDMAWVNARAGRNISPDVTRANPVLPLGNWVSSGTFSFSPHIGKPRPAAEPAMPFLSFRSLLAGGGLHANEWGPPSFEIHMDANKGEIPNV